MPIRLRLTLWYIALLGGTLVLFGVALYSIAAYSLYSDLDRSLQLRAERAVESQEFLMQAYEQNIRGNPDVALHPPPFDVFAMTDIQVEHRMLDGTLIQRSTSPELAELPLLNSAVDQARKGAGYSATATINGERVRLVTVPVSMSGRVWSVVQAGRSLADIDKNLRNLAILIVTGIGMTLIIALALGTWLAERALQPVDAVTNAALRISRAEDLSRRLLPHYPMDDIGRLIAAFNEMLGRLDDVFRDQQRFVADVSHELRTPLTALQGNIDLLKRGALEDPSTRQEALATIESEVARLSRLVADLLLLARADGGEQLALEPVEMDTLMLDVFRQGRLLASASAHPIRFRLGHEDQATVIGDSDRLKQLLLNLVDNAIKYTQEGEVTLSLWKDEAKKQVRIVVKDTGIGIPADALPLLFRRFYRADKARTRQLGGTGLGLAIVEWIVQAHYGTITVESEEGTGSTFTITLPLASPEELAQARSQLPVVARPWLPVPSPSKADKQGAS